MSDDLHGLRLEDLLADLGLCSGAGDDYRTRAEWRDAWGVSERRVMMILQAAKHEGKIKTTRVQREALDGALRWVPAYKFVLGWPARSLLRRRTSLKIGAFFVPHALDNVYTVVYTAGRLIERIQEATMSANAVWQMGEREIYDVCFEADDAPSALLPQICAHYLRQRWGREPSSAERAALVQRVRGESVPTNVQG